MYVYKQMHRLPNCNTVIEQNKCYLNELQEGYMINDNKNDYKPNTKTFITP